MGAEHDQWMQAFGIDLSSLSQPEGSGASPALNNPTLGAGDPGLQSALVDTGVQLGQGFVKGVQDTASGFVNSVAGQVVIGEVNPIAPLLTRAADAALSGDASKLAPPDPFTALENADPSDPAQQQQARATLAAAGEQGKALLGIADPIEGGSDAAHAVVEGDPSALGQGAGRVFVGVVPGLVTGGLAGLAEGGLVEGGIAEGGVAEAGPVEASAGAPPGEPPGPISSFDPALRDLPPLSETDPAAGAPESGDEPLRFGKFAPGSPGFEDSPDSLPDTLPAGPEVPVDPEAGDAPAVRPFDPPATLRSPPPQFDDPSPPLPDPGPSDPLPSGPQGPGFPFGVDPPESD